MTAINTIMLARLLLYVPENETELVDLYKTYIQKHNETVLETQKLNAETINMNPCSATQAFSHANSGFDLFFPESMTFDTHMKRQFANMKVKAEMYYDDRPAAFYLYPRSSISKTPLILANSVGVIDSGYRGELIGAFLSSEAPFTVEKHTRLLQICHPSLNPIFVVMTHNESDLSNTKRGSGGFGSTGV